MNTTNGQSDALRRLRENEYPDTTAGEAEHLEDVMTVAAALASSPAPLGEADARDAARWRWVASVRDKNCPAIQSMWERVSLEGRDFPTKDEWDAAIDAAMSTTPEASK